MEKSKLGISVALFSALLFFGAVGGILVIAVAAGYVLLYEESKALKKTSIKALILTIFLSVLIIVVNWLTNFTTTFPRQTHEKKFKITPRAKRQP